LTPLISDLRAYMRMGDKAQKLAIGSCCLFLFSLALPSVEVTVFQKPRILMGWEAALFSVGLFNGVLNDPRILVPSLAAVSNIVFLFAPWMVSRSRRRKIAGAYAFGVVVAFTLAVASPFALGQFPTLLVGYFLWIMAYVLLLGALTARAVTWEPS
jgi:hypothetical protein